jgi:hypothetical protein
MIRFQIILVFGTFVLMVIQENVTPHLAMKNARIRSIVTLLAYPAPMFIVEDHWG